MYRKLILAGAMTVALTAPALAEWNVLKAVPGPANPGELCTVVDRGRAISGEMKIAGPFATQAQAKQAEAAAAACSRPAK
jgi:hypothetical protein